MAFIPQFHLTTTILILGILGGPTANDENTRTDIFTLLLPARTFY